MELTRWINLLISGKAHPLLAPWLSGAHLTALIKPNNKGYRPIAVGDCFRRLASRLCCSVISPKLQDLFLSHGQMGVGVKGGLESIIHTTRHFIDHFKDSEDMCILKLDFSNAFNECNRNCIFDRVAKDLPEIYAWTQYYYHPAAELRFGSNRLLSTTGVQQGDPLGPLLFSLARADLVENINLPPNIPLQLWYLDDWSNIASREDAAHILEEIQLQGPDRGLHLNMRYSGLVVITPSRNFPTTSLNLKTASLSSGLLYGAPMQAFFDQSVTNKIDKVVALHSTLPLLEDVQVELHLLKSCLGICKINHLL